MDIFKRKGVRDLLYSIPVGSKSGRGNCWGSADDGADGAERGSFAWIAAGHCRESSGFSKGFNEIPTIRLQRPDKDYDDTRGEILFMSEILDDIDKEHLKILTEEYKVLCQGISQRVDFQQRLLNFYLLFLGITGTFIAKDASILLYTNSLFLLLFIPLVSLFFVWAHSNHDMMILAYAKYISHELNHSSWNYFLAEKYLFLRAFCKNSARTHILCSIYLVENLSLRS